MCLLFALWFFKPDIKIPVFTYSIDFFKTFFFFSFFSIDSHSGEWWSSDFQPQPGRQHKQIPRYYLTRPQGKTLECSSLQLILEPVEKGMKSLCCDCQMRAFTAEHICLVHSAFYFCWFFSTLSLICPTSLCLPVTVWDLKSMFSWSFTFLQSLHSTTRHEERFNAQKRGISNQAMKWLHLSNRCRDRQLFNVKLQLCVGSPDCWERDRNHLRLWLFAWGYLSELTDFLPAECFSATARNWSQVPP